MTDRPGGDPQEALRGLLGRRRLARDIEEEFEAHIAHRVDDLVAEGIDAAEARRRAEAEFGDRTRLGRASLAQRRSDAARSTGSRLWSGLARDARWAWRQLRRSPGFTGIVGATLMLGVGASVAIFSVVRAVVLDPLPYDRPDDLVSIRMLTPAADLFSTSEPAFLDWRERLETTVDVAALASRTETLRAPGEPRAVVRGHANAGFLELLGLEPRLGRSFAPAEDRPREPAPVALLGRDLWVERFGADGSVVGRTLDIDGRSFEVIGVLPEGLDLLFGRDVDVLTPLAADPGMDRGEHYLDVVARLAPGVTLDRARNDLQRVAAWQSATFEEDRGWSATLEPLEETLLGTQTIRAGWVLLAAAALLLFMACLNVSNLLLARATTRQSEIGLRTVLGAGRWPLIRQLCVESAAIGVLGTALGLSFAATVLPLVQRLGGERIPRLDQASLDPAAVGVALLVVVVVTGAAGLAPTLGVRSGAPARALRGSGRNAMARGGGLRRALVAVQVAASVVLLLGTGLLFRSFVRLSQVDTGFDPSGTLTLTLSMPDAAYDWTERGPLVEEILRRGREVPGVEVLGATAVDPFSGYALANFVADAERLPDRAEEFTPIQWRVVTPGLFEAMSLAVVAGRDFTAGDDGRDGMRVVIDERLAEDLFGGPTDAIGRDLVWGDPDGSRMRVVGVVEPLRDVELSQLPGRIVYRTHLSIPWASMHLVARVAPGSEPRAAAGLREAVRAAAPGLAVPEVRSLEANVRRALAEPRFNLLLLSSFAAVGLVLAIVGLSGLTAFEVRRRFREIGIRMSLGAEPESLVRAFVARRLGVAVFGLVAGLALAIPSVRALDALLFETSSYEPLTWALVVAIVGATTTVAAWLPARRAARVDPREVLSAE